MFFHESVVIERKKNSGAYCITIQYIVYLFIYYEVLCQKRFYIKSQS